MVSSLSVEKEADMAEVFIGVGSNIDREKNIRAGIHMLRQSFEDVRCSGVFETSAVGFDGDNFFNLVVALNTGLEPLALQDKLHDIEKEFGRKRGGPRYVARTLDLDLLLYDDLVCDEEGLQLPREDVEEFAFVLCPLVELAADRVHPVLKKSYAQMWAAFDKQEQNLWPVDVQF